jgi:1,4-alpha-glucan branching enzyme
MQPRHTETGTVERAVATPKARGPAPRAGEKSATEKQAAESPQAEKPKQQREQPKEKTVEFRLTIPHARTVCVVGTFNNWDIKRTPMQKDATGWKATIPLAPGRYEYRFVADGHWLSDPNAKESIGNDFGSTNSVLVV